MATLPVKEWWTFGVVSDWLARLASGPQSTCEGPLEEEEFDEDAEQERQWSWQNLASLSGHALPTAKSTFSHAEFDPAWWSVEEYLSDVRLAFNSYLQNYIRRKAVPHIPVTRDHVHYEWLARYQLLGQSFAEIAASSTQAIEAGTVKAAVFELRGLIALPPRRRRGRPSRKM